jgi:fibronectin-binding autotransporter adhesin
MSNHPNRCESTVASDALALRSPCVPRAPKAKAFRSIRKFSSTAIARKHLARALRVAPEIALRGVASALALFALFGFNPQALAASETWISGGATGNWSNTTNWSNGIAPGATLGTTSTDIATFNTVVATGTWGGSSANPIVIDQAAQNIGGINFDTNAGGYFIGSTGGNSLYLTSGGSIQILSTLASGNPTETINAPLVLTGANGTYTFANNSTNGTGLGTLDFGGGVTGGAAGATILTLAGSNTNANTISGVIGNGLATTVAVTKSGVGTWDLTSANTYTGATMVNAGILQVNFAGSGAPATNIISASSALTVSGGTLNLTGNASTTNGQAFASTTIGTGGSAITLSTSATANPLLLNLGAITHNTGGTVVFTLPSGTQSSTNGVVTSAGNSNSILGPWALVSSAGTAANGSANGYTFATVSSGNIVPYTTATPEASNSSAWGGIASGNNSSSNYDISATIAAGSDETGLAREINTIRYTGAGLSQESNGNSSALIQLNGLMNAGSGPFTIGGGTFFLGIAVGSNNELVLAAQNAGITINNSIENDGASAGTTAGGTGGAASALTITGAGGNAVTLNGASTYTGATSIDQPGTLSLVGTLGAGTGGGTAITNAGTFAETSAGVIAGTSSLTNVAGTTTLSGANTYTGTTTVSGGTLDFARPASLYNGTAASWTASNIVVKSGGTLAVQVGASNFTSANIGTLLGMASSATGGFETGSVLGLDTTPGNFTYSGGIANAYTGSTLGLAKLGANTLTLTGANTYTGPTNVNAGTLTLGAVGEVLNNTAVTVANGATLVATPGTGGISIGAAGGASLTLSGGSTLLLGSTSAASAESTTFNTLTLNGNLSIGGSSASAGLTFNLNNSSSDELVVSGAASFGADGGVITLVEPSSTAAPSGATQTYTLVSAGSGLTPGGFSLAPVSDIVALGGNSYAASLSETGGTTETLTLNEVTLTYYWTGNTSASWSVPGNFATDHTGAVAQTGALGATNNVILTADSPSGTNTASQTLDKSYAINSLTFSATAPAINLTTGSGGNGASNTLTLDAATGFGVTVGSSSPVTTPYGTGIGLVMQNGSAPQTLNVPIALGGSQTWEIDSPANELTVQGAISGAGYSLTKTGVGALILSASNTYSGGTFVNAGTLALGAANALLTTGTATVEGLGTLNLAGNNQTLAVLSDGGVATGTVTSSSGTPTLTIGSGAFSGTISGGLSLAENGSSTLTLSGVNPYTGSTAITSGTLTIGGAGELGSGSYAGAISNAGTFIYNSLAAQTFSGIISGAGALTDSGAGALTLSGNESFAGTLTVNAGSTVILSGSNGQRPSGANNSNNVFGTLRLQANSANTVNGISYALSPEETANGPLSLQNGATLQLRSDSSVTFAGGNNIGSLGSATVDIDVNQLTSAGSNNTLTLAPGGFATHNTTFNVTGGNGYTLELGPVTTGNAGFMMFNDNSANLIINGGITDVTTLTFGGGFNSAVTGAITNGAATTTLAKSGAGTLTLSGTNTYTGVTSISAGIVNYQNGTAFGTDSVITVSSGATVQVQGGITGGSHTLTLSGAGAGSATGALENVSGANSYGGLLALTGATTVSSDAGMLSLTNPGTITGSGDNLTLAGSGNGSIAGIIGTGAGALTKNGSGTWILSGANTYTGPTMVTGGILAFANESSRGV